MGRGDTQGLDSSSPAMCGLLCGRGWLVCQLSNLPVQLWKLRQSYVKQHRQTLGHILAQTPRGRVTVQECRGESGWCSDMTSTHGAWRHAGVRFLLSGDVWPVVWPWLAGAPAHPHVRAAAAAKAMSRQSNTCGRAGSQRRPHPWQCHGARHEDKGWIVILRCQLRGNMCVCRCSSCRHPF